MSEPVSFPIITSLRPAELKALLENELGEQAAELEFKAERQPSEHRFGLEWATLWLIAKGIATVAPVIFGLIELVRKNKLKKVRLVAQDGSVMEVPPDFSPALWEELLKANPQFRTPKEVIVE